MIGDIQRHTWDILSRFISTRLIQPLNLEICLVEFRPSRGSFCMGTLSGDAGSKHRAKERSPRAKELSIRLLVVTVSESLRITSWDRHPTTPRI